MSWCGFKKKDIWGHLMAHITNHCSSKQFGRSDFLVLRFFPLFCMVAAEGVKFWWVSTWSPVSPVLIGCVTPGSPRRSLPQTFVLPQAPGRAVLSSCAMPVSGANHLLTVIIHGGLCRPSWCPALFHWEAAIIQKCPRQPLDKQVVSSFWIA